MMQQPESSNIIVSIKCVIPRLWEVDRKGEESFKNFDLAAFAGKTFGMYGGADAEVTLECRNELVGVVIDRFGHDVWMCTHGEAFQSQSASGKFTVLWMDYRYWP